MILKFLSILHILICVAKQVKSTSDIKQSGEKTKKVIAFILFQCTLTMTGSSSAFLLDPFSDPQPRPNPGTSDGYKKIKPIFIIVNLNNTS